MSVAITDSPVTLPAAPPWGDVPPFEWTPETRLYVEIRDKTDWEKYNGRDPTACLTGQACQRRGYPGKLIRGLSALSEDTGVPYERLWLIYDGARGRGVDAKDAMLARVRGALDLVSDIDAIVDEQLRKEQA